MKCDHAFDYDQCTVDLDFYEQVCLINLIRNVCFPLTTFKAIQALEVLLEEVTAQF